MSTRKASVRKPHYTATIQNGSIVLWNGKSKMYLDGRPTPEDPFGKFVFSEAAITRILRLLNGAPITETWHGCPNHPDRAPASPSSNLCGPCLMGKPVYHGEPGEDLNRLPSTGFCGDSDDE